MVRGIASGRTGEDMCAVLCNFIFYEIVRRKISIFASNFSATTNCILFLRALPTRSTNPIFHQNNNTVSLFAFILLSS
jgi:hypothetical protein